MAILFLPLSLIGPMLGIGRCGFFFFVGCAFFSLHRTWNGQGRLVWPLVAMMMVLVGMAGLCSGANGIIRYVGIPGVFGAVVLALRRAGRPGIGSDAQPVYLGR